MLPYLQREAKLWKKRVQKEEVKNKRKLNKRRLKNYQQISLAEVS